MMTNEFEFQDVAHLPVPPPEPPPPDADDIADLWRDEGVND